MICPKCQNAMRTFDKSGVHIDQCEACHGIFLDRGELERILSAESSFYGGAPTPPPYQPGPASHGGHGGYGHADSPRPYRGGHGGYADSPRPYGQHGGHGHPRRQKSFLEQLFG